MTNRRRQRDAYAVATYAQGRPGNVLSSDFDDPLADLYRAADLLQIEDRRSFWPTPFPTSWEPARKLSGAVARLRSYPTRTTPQKTPPRARQGPSWVVGFAQPRSVLVCIRRKQRRQVLHALRLTGKGARAAKRRRTPYTGISCRR